MTTILTVANATFGRLCRFYEDPEARRYYQDGLAVIQERADTVEEFGASEEMLKELRHAKQIYNAALFHIREEHRGRTFYNEHQYERHVESTEALEESIDLITKAINGYNIWAADPGNADLAAKFNADYDSFAMKEY